MNGTDGAEAPELWLISPDGAVERELRITATIRGRPGRPTAQRSVYEQQLVTTTTGKSIASTWTAGRWRLTWHTAQDGLPTVSPDGRYVAFMSDRDGYWRLWFVPIEGGEAQPLKSEIPGELPKWLEHSMQWVR